MNDKEIRLNVEPKTRKMHVPYNCKKTRRILRVNEDDNVFEFDQDCSFRIVERTDVVPPLTIDARDAADVAPGRFAVLTMDPREKRAYVVYVYEREENDRPMGRRIQILGFAVP